MLHPYIVIHSVQSFLHLFHTFFALHKTAVTRMHTFISKEHCHPLCHSHLYQQRLMLHSRGRTLSWGCYWHRGVHPDVHDCQGPTVGWGIRTTGNHCTYPSSCNIHSWDDRPANGPTLLAACPALAPIPCPLK